MADGLYFTIEDLAMTTGLDEAVISSDIENGTLKAYEGKIWYGDAIEYSRLKWEEGKSRMKHHYSLPERMLARLDEQISGGMLEIKSKID